MRGPFRVPVNTQFQCLHRQPTTHDLSQSLSFFHSNSVSNKRQKTTREQFELKVFLHARQKAQKGKLTYLLIDVSLCVARLLKRFTILILLNRTWLSFFDVFTPSRDTATFGQLLWFEFAFSKPYFVWFSALILDHHAWLCVSVWQDAATL